ncbi:arginase/agmatinase/formiminoglutamase [Chryseotalea sanaruensis]|uniref:Arginase/agmatinase/formiminoglutamase n=1 Tax=Chryseotalea sanaruensis TaxID=2482724 RepID=A0A401UE21_9BACT|nr:agmatinase family protein [Chryseotalea sanaruensis]GCC53151.1 arginase/agmatinase/formiminoglutamase [Chryseotalea sanaruensis]
MTKEDIIAQFDPNAPGATGNLFGLPFSPENADLVIVPVPWEVTVSYKDGTAKGPEAILEASAQVDLFVKDIPDAWKLGVAMLPVPQNLYEENRKLRTLAAQYIQSLSEGGETDDNPVLDKINEACENLNIYVKNTTLKQIKEGKMVGLLGGDHSTPLGFLRALSERYDRFAVLQIDAHADLRKAYEGFTYSHASIMYNALKLPAVAKLVQVGIRDYCEEEVMVMQRAAGRVVTFFDEDIKAHQFEGKSWDAICNVIIKELPEFVYISFDIDGLDPKLCPNTGTPVAGGFQFHEVLHLIKKLVKSGKRIIGFDLNEVAPADNNEWDANVGARLLYTLCNWMAVSNGKLKTKN